MLFMVLMSKQQARNFECYVLISPWTSAAEELQSMKRRKNVCKNGNLIAKSIFKCQQYNENSYNMAKKTTEKIMGMHNKENNNAVNGEALKLLFLQLIADGHSHRNKRLLETGKRH